MIKRYEHAEQTISLAAHKEICQSIAEQVRERCARIISSYQTQALIGLAYGRAADVLSSMENSIRTADLSDITGKV